MFKPKLQKIRASGPGGGRNEVSSVRARVARFLSLALMSWTHGGTVVLGFIPYSAGDK